MPRASEAPAGRRARTARFLGYPVRGHTAPTLPVVAALARHGVAVEYHSSPALRPLVEGAGATFAAYPPGVVAALTEPVDSSEHLARCLAATEELLPSLLRADRSPDLVLFDASALWGGVAARRLGLPCVASVTTFAMNRALLRLTGAPRPSGWADPILARLGADDATPRDPLDLMVPDADLRFVYTSRAFQPAGRFFDGSHLFLGPLLDGRPRDGARFCSPGPGPLAYVSLGTLFRDRALLLHLSEILAARGWSVVVSLGDAGADPAGAWPEGVRAEAFVDQIGTLARADLFVTHGGMNGISEALSHAVPMIVVPQAVDQHLVARHAANLGVAIVVERDAVAGGGFAAALDRIARERAAFVAAATTLRASFGDVVPLADAVDRALSLARREEVLA